MYLFQVGLHTNVYGEDSDEPYVPTYNIVALDDVSAKALAMELHSGSPYKAKFVTIELIARVDGIAEK